MPEADAAVRTQLSRQIVHWTAAARRLLDLDDLASPDAWHGLESYLGLSVRQHLTRVAGQLVREGDVLRAAWAAVDTPAGLEALRRELLRFRTRYARVETTLDFFADAINTRTNPKVAGYLRASDILAYRSMALLLDQLDRPTPSALSYFDKGAGAAVLRARLRLWDGTGVNPVAAIKITRHNLLRNTALIHEAGHQAAALTGWTGELAGELAAGLAGATAGVAETWAGWASEIAADAFAFVHTGYAAVAALHDVVAAEAGAVFRHTPGDPHPISFVRVLLGVEMCREFYGDGPWDGLARAWQAQYPLRDAPDDTRELLDASLPLLPAVVRVVLREPARALGGRSLASLINPERVSPRTLEAMAERLGAALWTSMHWVWTEALRLLALTGLRIATATGDEHETYARAEAWLLRLGGALQTA